MSTERWGRRCSNPKVTFDHRTTRGFLAMDIFGPAVSIAYRLSEVNIHGKVLVHWRVSHSRKSFHAEAYPPEPGQHSGRIVMRLPADLTGNPPSKPHAYHSLAVIIGNVAHELRHVHTDQHRIRHVRKPTADEHGTPEERRAAHEERLVLRRLLSHRQFRARFDRLANRLHKRGIARPHKPKETV